MNYLLGGSPEYRVNDRHENGFGGGRPRDSGAAPRYDDRFDENRFVERFGEPSRGGGGAGGPGGGRGGFGPQSGPPVGDGRGSRGPQEGAVLMVYGLNRDKMNCDRLFNLLCLYGNVFKVLSSITK